MPLYAAITYTADVDWSAPEQAAEMAEYGEFGAAAAQVMRGGAALYPTSTATTVRVTGGKGGDVVTSDGPYAETKEVLTGFFLLECADLDEAIALAAAIPAAWNGAVEVRPVLPLGVSPHDGHEGSAEAALAAVVQHERRRVLATLVRTTGSLQVAEDALQDAVVRALETWPRDGVPAEPRAWLTLTARRRAVDVLRREALREGKEVAAVDPFLPEEPLPTESVVRDDLLRLVFTCCHPSLSLATQVALALRTLCGLSTAEVARALLVPEATMGKRLTRAKDKIAKARVPYRVPRDHELPDRVAGVAATVYLVFNEGYSATGDGDPVRGDLVAQALQLARLLHERSPDEPSLTGLLALLLLQDARHPARFDRDGRPVLLRDQDRSLWRRDQVEEAVPLVGDGLRRTPDRPDRYVVQAAVAACHALSPSWEQTDWTVVVSWYDVLLTVDPGPVVRLNRAVALAERDGPAAGLREVDVLEGLADYPLWHATRGELLVRLGQHENARTAYDAALALPQNAAQREHLERRRAVTTTAVTPVPGTPQASGGPPVPAAPH